MNEVELYPLLSTCSKRAIKKRVGRFGRPYQYSPRTRLIRRLAEETGKTERQVYDQLMKERRLILSEQF